MHDVNKARATPNVGGVRLRCSVCSQPLDPVDHPDSLGRPSLTCGLCGAVIFTPGSDVLPCQSCGQPILQAADGVKLCDGRIVHTVCA